MSPRSTNSPFVCSRSSRQANRRTPAKRLYTATEAAELVGVNIETVRRAIRSGQLGVAGRIGRSPRISRDAIDRWLASTIEMTDNGPRRRPRRRQSFLPEHSLRAAFRDP